MQMPARTPAATAMTVATLDQLSGGRVRLGLGTSGPQVVEGWHGEPWGKPLTRTREYVEIVRTALRRGIVEHHGEHYDIPYTGPGATGLGKPLKLLLRPVRPDVPVYLAAIGPGNVALAAEIGDGWLPIFFSPERFREVHGPNLERGFAARGGRPDDFDMAPLVPALVADDVQAARDFLKPLHSRQWSGGAAGGRRRLRRGTRRSARPGSRSSDPHTGCGARPSAGRPDADRGVAPPRRSKAQLQPPSRARPRSAPSTGPGRARPGRGGDSPRRSR